MTCSSSRARGLCPPAVLGVTPASTTEASPRARPLPHGRGDRDRRRARARHSTAHRARGVARASRPAGPAGPCGGRRANTFVGSRRTRLAGRGGSGEETGWSPTTLSVSDRPFAGRRPRPCTVGYKTFVTDPRVEKLAQLIVNYSLELSEGHILRIDTSDVGGRSHSASIAPPSTWARIPTRTSCWTGSPRSCSVKGRRSSSSTSRRCSGTRSRRSTPS